MLLLALFAFLVDIALRRLKLPVDRISRAINRVFEKVRIKRSEKKNKANAIENTIGVRNKSEDNEEKPTTVPVETKTKESKLKDNKVDKETLDTSALLKIKKK